jgi:hypothetical protein
MNLPLDKDFVRGGCGGLASRRSLLFQNSCGESEESHETSKPCPLPPPPIQVIVTTIATSLRRNLFKVRATAYASVTCNYMLVYLITV